MTRGKIHFTSNQIALSALGLSMVSSGFGVYQWWSSGREERIRAAIDLSDRYIDQAVSANLIRGEVNTGYANRTSLDPVKRQDARIKYIAFLANHGLVNSDYLAQRTVCDIVKVAGTESEAATFKMNNPKSCMADSAPASPAANAAPPQSN